MEKVIYDCEVLPNFFCVAMSMLDTEEEVTFYYTEEKDDRQKIIDHCLRYTMIGYNNHGYDDIIINYLIKNPNCSNLDLYVLSKKIVNRNKEDKDEINKYKYLNLFDSIDVMTMIASSKLRVSLKHLQVVIQWENVLEFECNWDLPLEKERWNECGDYCMNDVLSLKAVCKTLEKDFVLREFVQKSTGIECRSKDPVKIAEYAMCNAIAKDKGTNTDKFIRQVVDNNRPVKAIKVEKLLNSFIRFKTPKFQEVLKYYQNLTIHPGTNEKIGFRILLNGMFLDFGLGGLHHNYNKQGKTHKPQKGEKLLMPDVSSYYPSQRIELNYQHRFDPAFLDEYKIAYKDKADAKKAGNKMLEGYSKLKLNSVYGLYNSVYSPLYQPTVSYATAINGQLMLAMLIEKFDLNGIKVIGTNTDSISVIVKDEQWDTYMSICKEWEDITKMKLDHDEFTAIYEQSCNNYIATMPKGKVKAKGFFVEELNLLKGYAYPVVKKALISYFTIGKSVEEYIREHDNIYDFCMSTRMGVAKNGNHFEAYWNEQKLQRTNRYYASKGGNSAYLYKSSDGSTMEHVLKDSGVTIMNKYIEKPMKEYNINYAFYEAKCRKIINEIEPQQINMFV